VTTVGLVRRAIGSLVARGLLGSLDHGWTLATDAWFDLRWGTDTSRHVGLGGLRIDCESVSQGIGYQPTRVRPFKALMRELRPATSGGFVDYGCGKGRVLLMASEAGFRKVTGVEFSPELCEIARANVERYAARAGLPGVIRVVEGDAGSHVVGDDDTLFFFYFPFKGPVMTRVLARIGESLERRSRAARIVYVMPASASANYRECADMIARGPAFRRSFSRSYWGMPVEVFSS
jgi:SAM-dependent methyltransferase